MRRQPMNLCTQIKPTRSRRRLFLAGGIRMAGHYAAGAGLCQFRFGHRAGQSASTLRLELVVPTVVLGVAAGLAVILVAVFAGFAGRPTVDLGPFVLPMYASSGVFAYLCALLFVWITLRRDPRASSTLWWLSVLLPVGAALSVGAGMAIAWWRNFNPTPTVLAVVVGVVIVVHGTTACLARHKAVTGTRPETI